MTFQNHRRVGLKWHPTLAELVKPWPFHRSCEESANLFFIIGVKLIGTLPLAIPVVHDATCGALAVFEGVVRAKDVPQFMGHRNPCVRVPGHHRAVVRGVAERTHAGHANLNSTARELGQLRPKAIGELHPGCHAMSSQRLSGKSRKGIESIIDGLFSAGWLGTAQHSLPFRGQKHLTYGQVNGELVLVYQVCQAHHFLDGFENGLFGATACIHKALVACKTNFDLAHTFVVSRPTLVETSARPAAREPSLFPLEPSCTLFQLARFCCCC
mmetsp:Transcript_1832/g.3481  ORF Transcript_1832/g.3481 Transcript_1832/m.3481 type:complete len:270 (+) Transcript_1832:1114-1923(+)